MAAVARASLQAPAPAGVPLVIDGSDEDEEGGGEREHEAELEYLGQFKSQIVGIRYYEGTVGRNEMVKFVREPSNPYDANAVRVENIRSEKVGHLRRELVAEIAALMDGGRLVIEGMMTGTGKGVYTMPITIFCFGPEPSVVPQLARRLSRANCQLSGDSFDGADSSGALGRGGRRGSGAGVPNVTSKILSASQMETALDKMFEGGSGLWD
ncbi:Helicase-like transcription factor [Monoraphidium neglectum]|uniref:Helicase-like transcription factor n=1 Tax=Monoraphidium neglectum TaxID=145388 RepID=A0A0D2KUB8_9CHLO|nr:Helicase-like transcription factor [Monoraphidium neglectum]KIY99028.1 Helicase-like transcription factor [Monoraphidium neglectum]|eukprot:XP_013898048.1 Helicase-like transcription factor [Monoraphidium neglectum]